MIHVAREWSIIRRVRLVCGLSAIALTFQFGLIDRVAGQEEEAELEAIQETLKGLGKAFHARNWEEAEAWMTEKGIVEFKRMTVQSTFPWLNDSYAIAQISREDLETDIIAAYESHGVVIDEIPNYDDFDLTAGLDLMMEVIERHNKVADDLLDQSMNHDGLLTELTDILSRAPIPHAGEMLFGDRDIQELQVEEDTIYAGVIPIQPDRDGVDDISVAMTPIYIRFMKKEDDGWFFDGIDYEQTYRKILDSVIEPPREAIRRN